MRNIIFNFLFKTNYDDKIVVNFNCREEPETVPLPRETVTNVSGLFRAWEPRKPINHAV